MRGLPRLPEVPITALLCSCGDFTSDSTDDKVKEKIVMKLEYLRARSVMKYLVIQSKDNANKSMEERRRSIVSAVYNLRAVSPRAEGCRSRSPHILNNLQGRHFPRYDTLSSHCTDSSQL